MAFSTTRQDRENDKFVEVAGETAIRVDVVQTVGGGGGGDATAANQVAQTALLTTIDADTGSLAAKDFATQTTLASVLTELQLKADLTETQPVSAASLPLPSGASTSALQTTGNSSLSTIAGAISGTEMQVDVLTLPPVTATNLDIRDLTFATDKVDVSGSTGVGVTGTFFQATQPVSAASLPLPTGASTLAEQQSQTTILGTIDADTSTIAGAVSGTEMQVDIVTSTLPTGAATSANQATIIGHVDGIEGLLTTIDSDTSTIQSTVATIGATPLTRVAIFDASNAQITSFGGGVEYTEDAASAADPVGKANMLVRKDTPAIITSTDGDNIAQRGTNYGAAYTQIVTSGGAFVDSFGGGSQYTEGDVDASISGTAALWEDTSDTLRAVSMAKPLPVQPGTSVAFPVTDNGGSLTVDGTIAATQSGAWTLGANSGVDIGDVTINNASGASAVNIQDGGNIITVDGTVAISGTVTTSESRPATGTSSNVSGSATTITLLASNASRKGATIFNDSTAILYIKLGSTASTTSFTSKMDAGDYYEVPFGYTGVIDGIWASATGSARMTEIT